MSTHNRIKAPLFVISNETWSDATLAAVNNQTHGEAAIVIGQAHVPSVMSRMPATLETVAFVDLEPGHDEVFEAKMRALEAMPPDSNNEAQYAASVAGILADKGVIVAEEQANWLANESQSFFDATRQANPLGVSLNPESRNALLSRYSSSSIETVPYVGYAEDRGLAKRVGKIGTLGWVHLSNLAETTTGTKMAGILIDFINELDGLSDDTLVTYAVHDLYLGGRWRPSVHAARPSDITQELLLREQETFMLSCVKS